MENVHILVPIWVRTPLPEGVLVGAARYPLHQLYTIRNELCCKYITLILYSSQAGFSPPGKVGCRGLDTPSKSSVDEHNLYFARSAIIGYLAVET
jgi:hypothetical protein